MPELKLLGLYAGSLTFPHLITFKMPLTVKVKVKVTQSSDFCNPWTYSPRILQAE